MNDNHGKHYHSTIIISACIMAAAVITAASVFSLREPKPADSKPGENFVRQQFSQQLSNALKGKFELSGQERTLKRVRINDLRYHTKQDLILVEFSLQLDPPTNVTGSCILSDDGFRRYTGEWGRENCRVQFLIK